MIRNYGPCLCGAPDCPSCGPAQGYAVVRAWDPARRRYVYSNPPDEDEEDPAQVCADWSPAIDDEEAES